MLLASKSTSTAPDVWYGPGRARVRDRWHIVFYNWTTAAAARQIMNEWMNNTPLRPTFFTERREKARPRAAAPPSTSSSATVYMAVQAGGRRRRIVAEPSCRGSAGRRGEATHASRNLLAVCVCSRSRRRDRPVSVFVSYKYLYILVYSFICYLSAAAYVLQPVVTWFCICVLLMTEIDMQVRLWCSLRNLLLIIVFAADTTTASMVRLFIYSVWRRLIPIEDFATHAVNNWT